MTKTPPSAQDIQMPLSNRFACIGSVEPERPETWEGKIFVTVDLDWAIDEAIDLTLDLLDEAGVGATIFATHASPALERIRKSPRHELGIHPNFDPLLAGASSDGADEILRALKILVPEARCVRSHSLTQSSRLLKLFLDHGITRDCNQFIPATAGIKLRPYADWNGMIRVPYLWEDGVELLRPTGAERELDVMRAARAEGLRVLNFHPIHVALNSPNLSLYEETRPIHADWSGICRARFSGRGVATLLHEFLAADHHL